MITEEDISGIPGIVMKGGIYLLSEDTESALDSNPDIDIYVDGDSCPYCGAPSIVNQRHTGPGGWIYKTYTCGVTAATRPTEQRRYLLLAVSKPTSSCREYISLVAVKEEDII